MFYNNVSSYPSVRWVDGSERPVAGVREPEPDMDVITLGSVSGSTNSTISTYSRNLGCWLAIFTSDTTTQPGDSGAPVVTYDNRADVVYVIGIHVGIVESSDGSVLQCFTAANDAENVLGANIDTW